MSFKVWLVLSTKSISPRKDEDIDIAAAVQGGAKTRLNLMQ